MESAHPFPQTNSLSGHVEHYAKQLIGKQRQGACLTHAYCVVVFSTTKLDMFSHPLLLRCSTLLGSLYIFPRTPCLNIGCEISVYHSFEKPDWFNRLDSSLLYDTV
jgi:hypothetical protein